MLDRGGEQFRAQCGAKQFYPFRVIRNPETGSAFIENRSVLYRNRECANYLRIYINFEA